MLYQKKKIFLYKICQVVKIQVYYQQLIIITMLFADKIRQLREDSGQLQRKVAAALDVDAGLYSKIERGERPAKREQVIALASILHTDEKELLTLWLADKIKEITEPEKDIAEEAMEIVKMR